MTGTSTDERMPSLYLGHGAPILLDDERWTGELAALGAGAAPPPRGPHRLRALGVRAAVAERDRGRHRAGARLLRLRPQVLADALRHPGRHRARRPGRRADAGRAGRPPPRPARPRPRRLGAAARDVPRGRRPDAAAVDAHAGPAHPARPRPPPGPAARRGRPRRRLGLPHPRPAVPHRLAPRRHPARLVGGVRRVGRAGAGRRRRGRPPRLPHQGAGHALRPPDGGAHGPAVRHPRCGPAGRRAGADRGRRVLPRA